MNDHVIDLKSRRLYKAGQVCPGICTAREIYNNSNIYTRVFQDYKRDNEDYLICGFCNRIIVSQLVKCPECGRYFKSPARRYPTTEYECMECRYQ